MTIHAVAFSEWSGLINTLSGMLELQVNRVARVHVPAEPEVRFVSETEMESETSVCSANHRAILTARSCHLLSASDEFISCMYGGAGLCAGSCSVRSFSIRDIEHSVLQTSSGYPGRTAPPAGGSPLSGPNEICHCPVSCETACHLGIR